MGQIELCERTGGIERTGPWRAMKIVAEYLDKAIAFEQMAAEETDAKLRADLEKQAVAYRKLAAERAKKLKLSKPPSSQSP